MARAGIELNGVRYRWPSRPVVVVCIDGGDPAYFDRGVRDGVVPNVARFMKTGFAAVADGDVPSFTCPNNMSITTGSPPAVHGISGNFYLDRETGEAVVMTGPDLLRSRTIMAEFSRHGATVVSITAKDKLRRQLGKDMDLAGGSVNFSSECAEQCTLEEHGIENVLEFVGMPLPDIYSPELSLFVLEAGIRLLERRQPHLLYLSLTDYIQHKYAPGEPEADRYYRNMDAMFGRLDALGAAVPLTADRAMAARRFELPLDREGDVAVISRADTCIGASEKDHDLSGLRGHRLRTHGGISEAKVPFILNRRLRAEYAARAAAGPLRSYQI